MRSYSDLACGAIGLAIMIVAILNVALDPLDMLAAHDAFTLLILFHFSCPLFVSICEDISPSQSLLSPTKAQICKKGASKNVTFCNCGSASVL